MNVAVKETKQEKQPTAHPVAVRNFLDLAAAINARVKQEAAMSAKEAT